MLIIYLNFCLNLICLQSLIINLQHTNTALFYSLPTSYCKHLIREIITKVEQTIIFFQFWEQLCWDYSFSSNSWPFRYSCRHICGPQATGGHYSKNSRSPCIYNLVTPPSCCNWSNASGRLVWAAPPQVIQALLCFWPPPLYFRLASTAWVENLVLVAHWAHVLILRVAEEFMALYAIGLGHDIY